MKFVVLLLLLSLQGASALRLPKSFRGLQSVRLLGFTAPKLPLVLPPLFGSSSGDGGALVPPTPPTGGTDGDLGELGGNNDGSGNGKFHPAQALGLAFTKMLEGYTELLSTHMWPTKVVSAAVLMGMGDIIMQLWDIKRKLADQFDFRRLFIFSLVAAIYFAPIIHTWFNFLSGMPTLGGSLGSSKVGKALASILVDQTIGSVVVNCGFFYVLSAVQLLTPPFKPAAMEAGVVKSIWREGTDSLQSSLVPVLKANWRYWPFVNFLNFLYVPLQYQLLVSNVASVLWNIYLSGAMA